MARLALKGNLCISFSLIILTHSQVYRQKKAITWMTNSNWVLAIVDLIASAFVLAATIIDALA